MAKSRSYHKFLIESLKDPEEAALYLWVILQEEDPEPQLLPAALNNVEEALGELNMSPEAAKLHREKLDEVLKKQGHEAIYGLAEWLKPLGLELTVAIREELEFTEETEDEIEEITV
ncbi:MAG: transcriptional regulator [Gomphosphaeria aponina SAG 52.96 = DSM 107014]|uniref:Transcriptional regulator n=1 Tax=Gomphosphaeria aponina SAG 52.96 = DSM 107014 TaxID=1521640 RepID=A0A941GQT7_9CHRO|nr:transcriptional regulator [Gomphosphaeria aponina SAG 52.96 = DSM 107014]